MIVSANAQRPAVVYKDNSDNLNAKRPAVVYKDNSDNLNAQRSAEFWDGRFG